MNDHPESSKDNAALSFKNLPSIIKESGIVVLAVIILISVFCLVLVKQEGLREVIALKPAVGDRVFGLFSVYVAISLAIESALEIYLKVFSNPESQEKLKVTRITTITSLIVGIVVSFAGVRFLEPFFDVKTSGFQAILFHAIDILLTAGLLSGGSDAIHQITSLYKKMN